MLIKILYISAILCGTEAVTRISRALPPRRNFVIGRIAHPELKLAEYYFPRNQIAEIFAENHLAHPIRDQLDQFIADQNITDKLKKGFKAARKRYEALNSLSEEEKFTIVTARQLLGSVGELLERLPLDRAVVVSRLIALPDLGPLQRNDTEKLTDLKKKKELTIWDTLV